MLSGDFNAGMHQLPLRWDWTHRWKDTVENFKVDLSGIVELLSTAIYSTPSVYLRELIQNAVDAVTARQQQEPGWVSAGIRITPAGVQGPTMTIRDDGVGLTVEEINEFLATVGSSTKRDALGMRSAGMIGRFGIGLLSALMVSQQIIVHTRSVKGGPPIEWIGRGDGTWSITELTTDLPFGTTVILEPHADNDHLVSTESVNRLARHYARYLPVPIHIATGGADVTITEPPAFASTDPMVLEAHGTEVLGTTPFDVVPINVPLTGTRGVAYILPYPVPPQAHAAHTIYCSSMLVSQHCRVIAPDWAFFARIEIDSTGLNPTASREDLIDDEVASITRDAISQTLRDWITTMATNDPMRLQAFVAIHYLGLKSLAIHDETIAPVIVGLLPMETSRGMRSIQEILEHSSHIAYVPTTDQFRQINALTHRTIVNATYTWDSQLLQRLPELMPGTTVQEISVNDVLEALDPVSGPDSVRADDLANRANQVLAEWDARSSVRLASNPDMPSFLLTDPDMLRRSERRKAQGSGRWSDILGALEQTETHGTPTAVTLLNWANPLVRQISEISDQVVFARSIRLLHLQAILVSGRPLTSEESRGLTDTLTDLMILGITEQR
ncbi:hypothetical protein HMPREF1531_01774 [Propionibacterium sp. oral taxon 192 str. F0372]|uniref:HSP90 family protein n=1 Tax=Propionibacterium sp. oral taxon 192 TaxID=671222 RepID=UPI0003532F91|nr:HSP90 family protein [Propionibacterium sp. oral taxon 192]EPH02468.1 hypothetical protein HMPREF1531_01774 [Propionibacterium sp. oral taxon 192 str. F0372]